MHFKVFAAKSKLERFQTFLKKFSHYGLFNLKKVFLIKHRINYCQNFQLSYQLNTKISVTTKKKQKKQLLILFEILILNEISNYAFLFLL